MPKHRQIYSALREAILDGKLKADDALPSTRELAGKLGVSRNTVMTAYELLMAEGFIIGRGGAGTFVAKGAERAASSVSESPEAAIEYRPLSATADMLRIARRPVESMSFSPFAPSAPAADAFPYTTWSRIVNRHTHELSRETILGSEPLGHRGLRECIAEHLRIMRSCRYDPDRIIILSAGQQALYLCSILLMNQNDAVWLEEPGFPGAQLAFRARTSLVVPVPVDENGLDVEAGKARGPYPRVIYVTPAHQWPLGYVMPIQRRLALLDFAAEHKAWIVEDDYDGDLRFDGKTYSALQSIDEADRVIHVGSFSKTMFPGLRLGYAVLPPTLIEAFALGRKIIDRYPSTIAQAAMAEYLERGLYVRHVHDMQVLYAERHALLRKAIASKLGSYLQAKPAPAGTFTVTELSHGIADSALTEALMGKGIQSIALSDTFLEQPKTSGLLLGHAVAKPDEIRAGIDTIEQVISSWALSPAHK